MLMFLRLAVAAIVGLMPSILPAAAAVARAPTRAETIWAAAVVLGMVTALLLVTLLVSPSLRRRDEDARLNPEDPDASLYDGEDDTGVKPSGRRRL